MCGPWPLCTVLHPIGHCFLTCLWLLFSTMYGKIVSDLQLSDSPWTNCYRVPVSTVNLVSSSCVLTFHISLSRIGFSLLCYIPFLSLSGLYYPPLSICHWYVYEPRGFYYSLSLKHVYAPAIGLIMRLSHLIEVRWHVTSLLRHYNHWFQTNPIQTTEDLWLSCPWINPIHALWWL